MRLYFLKYVRNLPYYKTIQENSRKFGYSHRNREKCIDTNNCNLHKTIFGLATSGDYRGRVTGALIWIRVVLFKPKVSVDCDRLDSWLPVCSRWSCLYVWNQYIWGADAYNRYNRPVGHLRTNPFTCWNAQYCWGLAMVWEMVGGVHLLIAYLYCSWSGFTVNRCLHPQFAFRAQMFPSELQV